MALLTRTFGVAARNFTAYPIMPDATGLIEYGERCEQLGYDSIWVWDHILLGVKPCFPIIDSLTALTGIAARTRRIKLGTGILVLPLRNAVTLAKQLASMDQMSSGRLLLGMAAGWYKREFDAVGIPFEQRGKIMDENLQIMFRLWTEPMVSGDYRNHKISSAVMYPKPSQQPRIPILIGGYADKALQRAGVSGDGWLTYFYRPADFARSWKKVCDFATASGRDPGTLMNASQLPIMVGTSRSAVEKQMMHWLNTEWDFPEHSDCSRESAIMGTVEDCIAQIEEHLSQGVQKIIFVPYEYRLDQVEIIAREIIPRLRMTPGAA